MMVQQKKILYQTLKQIKFREKLRQNVSKNIKSSHDFDYVLDLGLQFLIESINENNISGFEMANGNSDELLRRFICIYVY